MLEGSWRTAVKVLVDHTEIFSRKSSKCSCPVMGEAGGHSSDAGGDPGGSAPMLEPCPCPSPQQGCGHEQSPAQSSLLGF